MVRLRLNKKVTIDREDDECEFLTKDELKWPYKYEDNPLRSIRRSARGDLVYRSILGKDKDYNKIESDRFKKKLTAISNRCAKGMMK